MTLLVLSFSIKCIISVLVYSVITLLIGCICMRLLENMDEDPGIIYVLGLVAYIISIVAFICVKEPIEEYNVAFDFGRIMACTANVMFIIPVIFNFIKSIPETISSIKESRRTARKERKLKIEIELKNKTKIFDL